MPPSTPPPWPGAEVLFNLSATNIAIGKAETRAPAVRVQSARCMAAYVYSAAGPGESTTDLAWDGQAAIYELGDLLAETERFAARPTMALRRHRRRAASARSGCARAPSTTARCREADPVDALPHGRLRARRAAQRASACERAVERFPFVPTIRPGSRGLLRGLQHPGPGPGQRLQATGVEQLVIGVSGGLDSTQALIVACRAFDRLGLPRTNVLAYTLPGFATSRADQDQRLGADDRRWA